MARVEKVDRALAGRLDECEEKMFLLKINYEKYFSGLERVEPYRAREEIRRILRDVTDMTIHQPSQRFRFQQLKARFSSLELYWNRNLVEIERGTHPKMKFRADVHERARAEAARRAAERAAKRGGADPAAAPEAPGANQEAALSPAQEAVLRERQATMEREERAYKLVYEKYLEARAKCGQSTDLAFEDVREVLRKQVRQIKSTYHTDHVKFRIVVEEGRARLKAVPVAAGT